MIQLTLFDLSLAATLVLLLAGLTWKTRIGLQYQLLFAAFRTTIQLLLLGLVLKVLFDIANPYLIALMALVMLLVGGREVFARQKRRFSGIWGFGVGTVSMFASSFTVTLFTLLVVIASDPWYAPQYAIPLLGMILGNTMNGISISMDRLIQTSWEQKDTIEQRLMLGQDRNEALSSFRSDAARSGLIPIINSMATAGIVSLPGMMTGQILAGSPPVEAVKYQILIMFMIASGTGFGIMTALRITSNRLFDERDRLRLDRLSAT